MDLKKRTSTRWKIMWHDAHGELRVDWSKSASAAEQQHWSKYIESVGGKVIQFQLTSQHPPKTEAPDVGAHR